MALSDGNVEQLKGNVNWEKDGDFLSRGAMVLMVRKLVLSRFNGCIQSYSCDIDGEFALSQHIFHKPEQTLVCKKFIKVQRVDQLQIFDNGTILKISCFFSCETGPPNNFAKNLEENWQNDLHLMSKYLEIKAKRKEELKEKFNTPCVKSALQNYIGSLIKCKPENVMNFTLDFLRKLEQSNESEVLKTFDRRRV